jgi:hypothetical protein
VNPKDNIREKNTKQIPTNTRQETVANRKFVLRLVYTLSIFLPNDSVRKIQCVNYSDSNVSLLELP